MGFASFCCTAFRWIAIVGCDLLAAAESVTAEPVKFCSTGTIAMGSFAEHIDSLRKSRRYEAAEIDKLVAAQRAGGPDFFSSQVVVKEEQSGSGDFDLNLFQGFSDAKYRSDKPWACKSEDYPIAYFVGFKFRELNNGSIAVSRDKGVVDVLSLKSIDPDLDKHTRVIDKQTGAVLCEDIAAGCVQQIFYGRW